jgi:radical SAM protein with 4Fe4S-binding SPASM domain
MAASSYLAQMAINRNSVRFNKEYFGYIVGLPEGEILLADDGAEDCLQTCRCRADIEDHLLVDLPVRPGFHLNTPPLVWLEITRKCNLNCPHCYIDGGLSRSNEMSSSDFHRIIDEMADMGVWAVAFTGGEPTLHPDFVELVNHARRRDLLVGIATNGMFLSEALLNQLPRAGVIISVSIDNLHIGNATAEFRTATQSILRSQQMGFLTNIMTNTHKYNIAEVKMLMNWAESHGVSVRSVPFSPLGRGKLHQYLQNTADDVQQAAEFWMRECEWEHEYHLKAGLCVGVIFNYGLTLAYMSRRCSSGRFLCYVCADGTVYPCTMCAGERILSPGNLRNDDFAEFWRRDWEIRKYSWDNFKDTCRGCVIDDDRYYCASRCPAMSHARNNELFGCGASEFEKLSTIVRTAMLEQSPVSRNETLESVEIRADISAKMTDGREGL